MNFKEKEQRRHTWYYMLYKKNWDYVRRVNMVTAFSLLGEINNNNRLKEMNRC